MDSMPSPDGSSRRPRRSQLARCRWLKGFTQRQLAELAGVGRASIVRAESGAGVPTLRTASRLARALGEPVGALFPQLADEASNLEVKAPQVATVAIETLRDLQGAVEEAGAERRARLAPVVADLIAAAQERSWPL